MTYAYHIDDKIIEEMVQVIVREVNPVRIILFGSRATENFRPDSDIDLLIIEKEPFGPDHNRYKAAGRLYRALSKFFIPKDILLFSVDEAEERKNSLNHVIGRAYREGKVLYECI